MQLFPTKNINFRLLDSHEATLDRFRRRTEESQYLTSQITDKSFRGRINGNEFTVISSAVGKGALCVMSGEIGKASGTVNVSLHTAFKVLFSFALVAPLVLFLISAFSDPNFLNLVSVLVLIGQTLMIRYVFIGLAFRFQSKESLSRLRDVLDLEWVKK